MSVAGSSTNLNLEIDGMHCEACVRRATQALSRAGQGEVQEVSIGKATVAAPSDAAPALVAALAKAGFAARVRE
jgi:copper chaperone CopZ